MSIRKMIEIDGKAVEFKASAAIPRIYRLKDQRDIYTDLAELEKSISKNDTQNFTLDSFSLEMFETIAYIIAKHANPKTVLESPEEWLEEFNTFSIYQILPKLIKQLRLNIQTQVETKKTSSNRTDDDRAVVHAEKRSAWNQYPGSGSSQHRHGERHVY